MSPTSTSISSAVFKEITLQKYRGTLSLLGPAIDDLALSSLRQAQDSDPNFSTPHQQRDREQPPYHITFLTKDEFRNLSPENHDRVDALLRSPSSSSSELKLNADLDTSNIFSLGVGSFSAVYWTVIIWAAGQKLRKLLSLPPKHFHITLSSGPDIHDPPLGKGVDSLIIPLDFSFLSSSSSSSASLDVKPTTKKYDDLPTTHLDHLTFTLHLFHSHPLSQQCATALILRDELEAAGGYKGFLRYADACWALRKYKLAMLAYGCVWERVALILRIQKRREKRMKMRELELEGDSTDNNNDDEVKAHTKIQAYALKKLAECARHTEWGHVFRSDEVEDIVSPHPLLHDDVRAALIRVWGEELRSAIRVLVDKRGTGMGAGERAMEDMGNENNPRTALFIPVFNSSTYQDQDQNQNQKREEKKKQKRKFEFYRLPRFFSWVVPFHLALMSTPKSHADVRALASGALGIRRVVTLTEEERLPGTWFRFRKGGEGEGERERDIVNTFIPVKNECPPSIEQMDCVVRYFMQDVDEDEGEEGVDDEYGGEEEEDQEGWRYHLNHKKRKKKKRNTPMLIHCGGGKGRAGTVAACYLVSFGFGPPPPPLHPHPTSTSTSSANTHRDLEERESQNTTSPKMSSQAAITALRALRPGSLETSIQERFVSEWASTIWKRRSVFPPEGLEEPMPLVGAAAGAFGFGLNLNVEVEGSLSDFTTEDPMLIILVGLPGAGKSWFAKALTARDPTGWVYVSQDEIGSREVCERVVARGPLLPRRVDIGIGALPQTQTSPGSGTRVRAGAPNTSRSTSRSRGLILDRCNPTSTDRKTWISLVQTWTDRVLYVHFDYPPELCVSRAQRRVEHPTLQPGGRVRAAVKAVGDVFEAPGVAGEGMRGKGVRAVVRIRNFAGAREAVVLVDGLGRRSGGGGGGGGGTGGVVMKFPRTPHLMDLGGAGGDDVWVEGGVDGFMRGASPRVLGSSSSSASASASASVEATRESRNMEMGVDQVGDIEEGKEEEQAEDGTLFPGSVVSRPPVTSTTTSMQQNQGTRTEARRRKTVITEKLDGANMGLSLSPDGRTILVQNRSHYITSNSHAQFKKLDAWLARCGEGVRRVLLWSDVDVDADVDAEGWFPDRWILYGEWLAARHSVGYDDLEDWFVAFDLYDRVGGVRRKGGFVDGETMRRRCAVGGIVCVPVLFDSEGQGLGNGDGDVRLPREEELVRMVQERSVCGEERREGVVVKIEEWVGEPEELGWVKARGKIVRGDFIPGNEHWTKGQLVYNKLREEY